MTPQEMYNQLLTREEFSLVLSDKQDVDARVLDCEGNLLFKVSPSCIDAIEKLEPEDALEVLLAMHRAGDDRYKLGVNVGRNGGRAEIVDTIHEALGVYRIVSAIEEHTRALYEVGSYKR
jgi:hypothetical protein